MKHFQFIFLALLCLSFCIAARAQENTKQAFERLVQSKKSAVTRQKFVEQYDVRKKNRPLSARFIVDVFTVKEKDHRLVDDIVKALENDHKSPNCYSIYKHEAGSVAPICFVYDDKKSDVCMMGKDAKSNYTLICLADPDDTTKTHRYVYGIEWEPTGKNKEYIVGKLLSGYGPLPSLHDQIKHVKNEGDVSRSLLSENISSDSAYVNHYDETLWLLKLNKMADIYVHAARNSMQRLASAISLWNMCRKNGGESTNHELKETTVETLDDLIEKTSNDERLCRRYLLMAKEEIAKIPEKK